MMRGRITIAATLLAAMLPVAPGTRLGATEVPLHPYTMSDFAAVRKYDAHVHANSVNRAFL